jgi:phosphoribosylaminoimidazole-succinocarboxamide synthase
MSTLPEPSYRGKVRDVWDLGDRLLLVASDRLSAFDVVFPDPIPGKGAILTRMSAFWFGRLAGQVPHHLLSTDPHQFPSPFRDHEFGGRAMLVSKAQRVDFECIVRGRLTGSGFKEYQRLGTVSGHPLPAGLKDGAALPQPLFTPSTKAATGHDENVAASAVVAAIGPALAARLERLSLELFAAAAQHCASRGVILVDTKFEFGRLGDQLLLIDEVLTPDSSRFWLSGPAGIERDYDKQYLRRWLEDKSGWNKEPPAPHLSPDLVDELARRYSAIEQRLTHTPSPSAPAGRGSG